MFHGWWIVSTHFMAQLFVVGFIQYSYPILVVPVEAAFDSGMETISYAMIAANVIGLLLPPFVGPLVDRWSARSLMLIGAGCLTLGLLALSLSANVVQFIAAMGFLIGSGNVLLGPTAGGAVVSRWFIASRGRALGIAAIGTSIGGILMPQFFAWGIDEIGWRAMLRWTACALVITVWPLLLFAFRDHPRDLGMEPEGGDLAAQAQASTGPDQMGSNAELLRMPAFWILSSCLALFLAGYTATTVNLPKFASDLGVDGASQGLVMTVLATSGLIGKLLFGYVADRVPLKLALYAAIGLTALGIWGLTLEPSYTLLLGIAVLLGLATGGILPVWGSLVGAIFGVANFGRTMGLQGPAISLAAVPTFWVAGRIYDSSGSFVPAFQLVVGMLLASALILILLRVPSQGAPSDPVAEGSPVLAKSTEPVTQEP